MVQNLRRTGSLPFPTTGHSQERRKQEIAKQRAKTPSSMKKRIHEDVDGFF